MWGRLAGFFIGPPTMTGTRFVFRQEQYRECKSGRCNPGPPHTCILAGRRRERHACDTSHHKIRQKNEERWSSAYEVHAEYSGDTGLSVINLSSFFKIAESGLSGVVGTYSVFRAPFPFLQRRGMGARCIPTADTNGYCVTGTGKLNPTQRGHSCCPTEEAT